MILNLTQQLLIEQATLDRIQLIMQITVFFAVIFAGGIVLILMFLGQYGRTLLFASMPGSNKALIQVKTPTGRHVLYAVKPRGQVLYKSHKLIWFLPRLLKIERGDDVDLSPEDLKKIRYNEILKSKDSLNGKALFLASQASSLAFTPDMLATMEESRIIKGSTYPRVITLFLKDIQKAFKSGLKNLEISLMTPFNIDTIEEYVNMSYSPDEIDETYRRGYLKGLGDKMALQSKVQEYMPILFIIAGVILILVYAWDTGILGGFLPVQAQ